MRGAASGQNASRERRHGVNSDNQRPVRQRSPFRTSVVWDCNFNGVTPETEETPVTDVTSSPKQDREPAELSAADEQLLRELTERARTGGLQLTGEGGLLGKLTKMVVEGALEGELMITSVMPGTTRPAATAAIPATGIARRMCSPRPGRWRYRCRGTGMPASSRRSWPSGSGG